MKILTTNFLTCAVKACKTSPASFPLHFKDAELEKAEVDFSREFLVNVLGRVEWDALRITASELGFTTLPETKPTFSQPHPHTTNENEEEAEAGQQEDGSAHTSNSLNPDAEDIPMDDTEATGDAKEDTEELALLKDLHTFLLETQVMSGKLVCGNCGHEYKIKEGIANFLLPDHLV